MTARRENPKHSKGNTWIALVFGVVFVLAGLIAGISFGSNSVSLWLAAGSILAGGFVALVGIRQLKAGNVFKRGSSKAQAVVLKRNIGKRKVEVEHTSYEKDVFELEVKFTPPTGNEVHALAEVSKELYALYGEGKTISIEYANANPLVFMIEGE